MVSKNNENKTASGIIKSVIRGIACVVLTFFVFFAILISHSFLLLLFGWLKFIQRTLPKAQLNSELLVLAGCYMVIVICGGHCLAAWIYHYKQGKKWQKKWTASGVLAIFALFAIAVVSIGLRNHIHWLSQEPEHKRIAGGSFELDMIRTLTLEEIDGETTVEQMQQELQQRLGTKQNFIFGRVIYLGDRNGVAVGVLTRYGEKDRVYAAVKKNDSVVQRRYHSSDIGEIFCVWQQTQKLPQEEQ